MTKMSLTPRQTAVYAAIRHHLHETGTSPSFADLMKACGLKSKGHVSKIIYALEERGYIMRLKGRARSITLVPDARDELLELRRIRDAAAHYLTLQEDYAEAYTQDPKDPKTIKLGQSVMPALIAMKRLVRGERREQ